MTKRHNCRNRSERRARREVATGPRDPWKDEFWQLVDIYKHLEESQERYSSLFESAPAGYASLDRHGCVRAINATGANLLGYSKQCLVSRPLLPLLVKRDQCRFLDYLSRLTKQAASATIQLQFCRRDKRQLLLQLISQPAPQLDGQAGLIRTIFADVTSQRERELAERREHLPALFEPSNDASPILRDITYRLTTENSPRQAFEALKTALQAARSGEFRWDLHSNIISCSSVTEELYGLPAGRFQGRPSEDWLAAVHPDDFGRLRGQLTKALAGKDYLESEFRVRPPLVRWIQARFRVFRDEDGKPVRLVGVHFDITSLKASQEGQHNAQARLQKQFEDCASEVSSLRKTLQSEREERRRLQSQLLAISEREQRRIGQDLHDSIGQQLTGLKIRSEALLQKVSDKSPVKNTEARQVLELIKNATFQTQHLARGLYPVLQSPNGLLLALGQLAQSIAAVHGVVCRFHCPKPVLVADNVMATHLFRIAQESLHNSIRHGRSKWITLGLTATRDGIVRLRIRDNGRTRGYSKDGPEGGLGRQIMKSRCDAIGALLTIKALSPHGTLVECLVQPAQQTPGE